jgi:maltokinase
MDPTDAEGEGRLPAGVEARLAGYLAGQRWYAGEGEPERVRVLATRELCPVPGHDRALIWAVVEVEGDRYQLLIGRRHNGDPADFLSGHEQAFVAGTQDAYYYDAMLDPDLCLRLLPVVTGGVEFAGRVRPIGVEQSNTSLVYDDRLIAKFYRRLLAGPNPDVQVTNGLARIGFRQVAAPVASWRDHGFDLAFVQEFLAGGTEGWALALTSLRDFYHSDIEDPGEAGGDFSVEARRLGRVTAELHLAMRQAWPEETGPVQPADWGALLERARTALDGVGEAGGDGEARGGHRSRAGSAGARRLPPRAGDEDRQRLVRPRFRG